MRTFRVSYKDLNGKHNIKSVLKTNCNNDLRQNIVAFNIDIVPKFSYSLFIGQPICSSNEDQKFFFLATRI